MESNEVLDKLPKHLMSLVIDQPYNEYSWQDHAVWRYVMRQNVKFLGRVAHESYLEGLKKTGISIEHIPSMYGMNRILKEIGWAAAAVDGFVPPAAFMAFQAYNVLVIAADIRPIDQIGYTPAPDIIHEAAGHAPIIADPDYADFLRRFGFIGSRAFLSPEDHALYEAIRHLSIIKADPYSSREAVDEAEKRLSHCSRNMGEPSELARIRNLHWWTVEYGLIGNPESPRIYGAGLLSSIEESYLCLQPHVKKIPLTIDAATYNYDITEPQPQLFITPDFAHLNRVLDEFSQTLAQFRGGSYGIMQAVRSADTATCVYNSGLQVSGTFTGPIEHNGEPAYLRTDGPSSLCYADRELPGHDRNYHAHGFGSPVGKLKNMAVGLETMSAEELGQIGLNDGERVILEFDSGVKVEGTIRDKTFRDEQLLLISFTQCRVTRGDEVLFSPEWGIYDMAVGSRIVSAFSGPADAEAFGVSYPVPEEKTHKFVHTEEAEKLHELYRQVREIREGNATAERLAAIWEQLKRDHPGDWLLPLEILEIVHNLRPDGVPEQDIRDWLGQKKRSRPELNKLIQDGLSLIQ